MSQSSLSRSLRDVAKPIEKMMGEEIIFPSLAEGKVFMKTNYILLQYNIKEINKKKKKI